jgi:hypothetical protein
MSGTSTIIKSSSLAKIVFDVALYVENSLLGFTRRKQRLIASGQYLLQFGIVADARSSEIGGFV